MPSAKVCDLVAWRMVSCAVVAATLVGGCTSATPEAAAPPVQTPAVKTFAPLFDGAVTLGPPDLTDEGPGSLVSIEVMHGSEELEDADAT